VAMVYQYNYHNSGCGYFEKLNNILKVATTGIMIVILIPVVATLRSLTIYVSFVRDNFYFVVCPVNSSPEVNFFNADKFVAYSEGQNKPVM
jgi:hypothetical protein